MIQTYKWKRLTEDQLALLIYVFKDSLVDAEGIVNTTRLSSLRMEMVMPKLKSQEGLLTDEGKEILNGLMVSLTSFP